MASTFTTFAEFLKLRYTDKKVESMIGDNRPLLGMLTKQEDLDGESLTVPLIRTNAQGVAGASRALTQTNKTNLSGERFVVTLGEYFGTTSIGDKVVKASRRNVAAFLDNKTAEIDSLYEQMSDSLASYVWGNGGGSIGRISAIATDVFTLSDPSQIVNFEENMEIVLSANDGATATDTLRAGNSTVTVIDRASGKITVTASEITGEAVNDYIFRQGDFFGDQGVVVIQGMQKQIDGTGSPEALYGMTRTGDPVRLSGCYVPSTDLSGKNIEQRLQTLGTYMAGRYRSKVPGSWFIHPENWQQLSFSLQSRGQRSLTDSDTQFGYEYLELLSGGRRCRVYSDPYCPKGKAFAISLPNFWLGSLGKLIHPIDVDGLTLLRAATTDDYEYRLKSYPALYTNAPVRSGVVSLT